MSFWNDPLSVTPKQSHKWVIYLGDEPTPSITPSTLPVYYAKSAERPSYEIPQEQAKLMYSYVVNIPKRLIWKPIKIEFYDIYEIKYYSNDQLGVGTKQYKLSQEKTATNGNTNKILSATKKDNNFSTTDHRLSTSGYFQHLIKNAGYFYKDFSTNIFKNNLINALLGRENNLNTNDITTTNNFITIKELNGYEGANSETWKLYNPIITSADFSSLNYENADIGIISINISYDWAVLNINQEINETYTDTTIDTYVDIYKKQEYEKKLLEEKNKKIEELGRIRDYIKKYFAIYNRYSADLRTTSSDWVKKNVESTFNASIESLKQENPNLFNKISIIPVTTEITDKLLEELTK